jgi:excisionase family DNA binding protein
LRKRLRLGLGALARWIKDNGIEAVQFGRRQRRFKKVPPFGFDRL